MNADTTKNISQTDWARIDAMSDEDIDTSDIPPLSADFWAKAQLRTPKKVITALVQNDNQQSQHHKHSHFVTHNAN